jgi:hypothetical protein
MRSEHSSNAMRVARRRRTLGICRRETLHSAFNPLRLRRQDPEGPRLFPDGVILASRRRRLALGGEPI